MTDQNDPFQEALRPRERRVEKRASFSEINEAMQLEADKRYEGNLEDNALTIFNQLTTSEKRTFLRYAVLAIASIKKEIAFKERAEPPEPHVDSELKKLKEFETEEHQKFVNFLTRLFFTVLIVVFILFVAFAMLYGNEEIISSIPKRLTEVLDILIKM